MQAAAPAVPRGRSNFFGKRLPIGPYHSIFKVFFLPDRHGFLQRVNDPAAGFKRRAPVRRSHHDQHAGLANLQPPQAGGRSTLPAPQNAPAPPPPGIPFVSAPWLHRLHSPDRACAAHAYCRAPRRRKSLPRHPPGASTARPQPRDQSARGRSGPLPALCPRLHSRSRLPQPTRRSPAATAPLRRLRRSARSTPEYS